MGRRATTSTAVLVVLAGVAVGAALGTGGYTFIYARGLSYLSDDPAACANCHVMNPQHDRWHTSSHHAVATCNDCHTPANPLLKYVTKARNGWHHGFAFTSGDFPDVIQITPTNHEIARDACVRCHADVVESMGALAREDGDVDCVQCHGAVGHPL